MAKKFYVTTPIYYVTARPHLGSLYSTILADIAARWHKLRGIRTFFLTGTDEHGQKIAQAAEHAGMPPQEFVDSFIDAYKDMWSKYKIEYDAFIRTTDKAHIKAVQDWLSSLMETGDIYKSFYEGYYCTPCETYVTEEKEPCPTCGRDTVFISEESYFFKLSAYQDRLLSFYEEHPDFIIPSERAQEVINFVKGGLKDLSVSRTTVKWGIPFPGDEKHVAYVWADALNNYITAIGYNNEARKEEFNFWWPADLQILGKDIVRFHAIYWPAFLMASNLPLPHHLLVHGWILVDKQKMSKSFGNVIEPQTLLDAYGAEPVRYYLTRYMAITHDSEFNTIDLEQKLTSDLANDLGNLLNRMVALAEKHTLVHVQHSENLGPKELELRDSFWTMLDTYIKDMEDGYYYRALSHLWKYIHQVNAYFHESKPWKVSDAKKFEEIISATCHSLYGIGVLLQPVMPDTMKTLLASIGSTVPEGDAVADLQDNPWKRNFMLTKIPTLFPKYEPQPKEEKPTIPEISIEDFAKVVLAIGTILDCQEVKGSDRLLKLQVDCGSFGKRQILAGVKKYFSSEDLIGKQALFVLNLKPRKMMGELSEGMLLSALDEHQKPRLVTTIGKVPPGTRLC